MKCTPAKSREEMIDVSLKIILSLTIIWICCTGLAMAGDYGTTSGLLLNNPISSRVDGMAGAQAAVTTDEAGALSGNPAGLLDNSRQELSAIYYRGLIEDMVVGVSYSCELTPMLAVGGGFLMYDGGSFELISAEGATSNLNAQRDLLANLTLAYKSGFLGQPITAGINLKLLNSTLLEQYSAFAVAADFGLRWELKGMIDNLFVGAAVKNIGTPMKYVEKPFSLPLYGEAGLAYRVLQGNQLELLLAADVQSNMDHNLRENFGAEIWILKQVAIRGGYKLGYDIAGLSFGAGLRLGPANQEFLQLDYAYDSNSALDNVHRISLSYVFGQPAEAKPTIIKPKETNTSNAAELAQYNNEVNQPNALTEPIPAEIIQDEKTGGRVSSVLLSIGSNQGCKVGFKGVILNSEGQSIAGLRIQDVNANKSIAEVVGISRDLGKKPTAVIYKPR